MTDHNESDDYIDDELFDDPPKKHSSFTLITILLAIIALSSAGWYIYDSYQEKNDNEMLLITAEQEEIKVQPIDPGGMIVDNMDKSVYNSITAEKNSYTDEPQVEILLQPSEEPIDKSTLASIKEEDGEDDDDLVEIPPKKTIKEETSSITETVEIAKTKQEKTLKTDNKYLKPVPKKSTTSPRFVNKLDSNIYKVQLASFKSSSDAEKGWNNLLKKYPSLLNNYKHYIVSKEITGRGLFYRLQIGPFKEKKDATKACENFKNNGMSCLTVNP
jgi:cell division septation protein DedD